MWDQECQDGVKPRTDQDCRDHFWYHQLYFVEKHPDKMPIYLRRAVTHCRDDPTDQDWCHENVPDLVWAFLRVIEAEKRAKDHRKYWQKYYQ